MKTNFAMIAKVETVVIFVLTPLQKLKRSRKVSWVMTRIRRGPKESHSIDGEGSIADAARGPLEAVSEELDSLPPRQTELTELLEQCSQGGSRDAAEVSSLAGQSEVSNHNFIGRSPSPTTSSPLSPPSELALGPQNASQEEEIDPKMLLYDFNMSRQQLESAQQMFEDRQEFFDQERREWDENRAAGEQVKTLAELEMDELQETQRLTRAVITAEGMYENAKVALFNAGIQPPGSDVESGFVDDVKDGYRLSFEEEVIHSVDPRRIQRWLEDIPKTTGFGPSDPGDAVEERDVDTWSAVSVAMCDSWSMVADGAQRRRIDKWKALAAVGK